MPSAESATLNHSIVSWRNAWVDKATEWAKGRTQEEVLVAMLEDARKVDIPELDFDTSIDWKTLKAAVTKCAPWAKLHWYIVTITPKNQQ